MSKAGRARVERTRTILEIVMLPLHHRPEHPPPLLAASDLFLRMVDKALWTRRDSNSQLFLAKEAFSRWLLRAQIITFFLLSHHPLCSTVTTAAVIQMTKKM